MEFLKRFKANKLNVFVEADQIVRLKRRVKRDTENFGVTEQQVRELFFSKVELNNRLFVEPQKSLSFLNMIIHT